MGILLNCGNVTVKKSTLVINVWKDKSIFHFILSLYRVFTYTLVCPISCLHLTKDFKSIDFNISTEYDNFSRKLAFFAQNYLDACAHALMQIESKMAKIIILCFFKRKQYVAARGCGVQIFFGRLWGC